MNELYDKDYVQYSKRVTKWAMILIAIVMIACLAVVAFTGIPVENVNAVVQLFGSFCTVLGVTIGAYQGNSTLEKYSKAKYQYENMSSESKPSAYLSSEYEEDELDDECNNG